MYGECVSDGRMAGWLVEEIWHACICSDGGLKDDVLVVLVTQQVFALCSLVSSLLRLAVCICGLGSLLLLPYGFFGGGVTLLLSRDFLQTVEFLAVELVELRVDVLDRVLCAGDDDVLAEGLGLAACS